MVELEAVAARQQLARLAPARVAMNLEQPVEQAHRHQLLGLLLPEQPVEAALVTPLELPVALAAAQMSLIMAATRHQIPGLAAAGLAMELAEMGVVV
jgi:hypothetical protein